MNTAASAMKVLHVIPSVGPLRGGPSVVIRTITEALSERGVTVDVATTDDNARELLNVRHDQPIVEDGVTYRYFRRQTRFYTASWPLYRWLAAHSADYDVIHIHAMFSFASTAAAFVAARRGVPYVVRPLGTLNSWGITNRRPQLKQFSLRFVERPLLSKAACVHFTSEQERVEAGMVVPEGTSRIIPNPVNAVSRVSEAVCGDWLAKHPALQGKRFFLFLSRLDLKKGLDLLLDAFRRVHENRQDVALVIAGNGDPEFISSLKQRASELKLGDSVVWTGFVERANKQAALQSSCAFVLPSYSENFGIAVVEAMSAGVPVVVSDQVAIHRDISEAGAGLVVPCDADPLADAMIRVLDDAPLRDCMGRRGKQFAEREYSREAVSRKLIDLYNEILN